MKTGLYPLDLTLYDSEDNAILITCVKYFKGYPQTETDPVEPAYVEVCCAEDEDGVGIEELDEINVSYYDEIEKAWNKEYPEGGV